MSVDDVGKSVRVYLVGGAVRDQLLGLTVKERDWVVVGGTPEALLDQGYQPVGREFPVFLHPKTREEYALARTERKTAPGYRGFDVHAAPDVTLEEDLGRRDLTVNAMARAENGALIDPFGGQDDLKAKCLRHISPAFMEDPVRILRVARFAARYANLGFTVSEDTRQLMHAMVQAGEVDALVPERVFQELEKALGEECPDVFFEVLRDCGALMRLFPEVDRLFGVPQDPDHHPEIDCGVHTLLVLRQAANLGATPEACFAALVHDIGKGLTAPALWPNHPAHESAGVALIKAMASRLRLPARYHRIATKVTRFHGAIHHLRSLSAQGLLELISDLDGFRQENELREVLLVCMADSRGRTGHEDEDYPQATRLKVAFEAAKKVSAQSLMTVGMTGPEVGQVLFSARVNAINEALLGLD